MREFSNSNNEKYIVTVKGEQNNKSFGKNRLSGLWRDALRTQYLIRLEIKQQSFGLTFGNVWLILEPALQAGAYYFLLTVVFAMRGSDATFAFFFVAITLWRSHSTLVTSAPYFLNTKGHQYIEQGFGLKIAFLEFAAHEVLLFFVRCFVLGIFLVVSGYYPSFSWLFLLYIALAMFCFSLALSVWLAMAGALFKDVAKLIGHFVWLWWYLSPGLYSIQRIPAWAEPIFFLNPFSYIIPASHAALLDYTITQHHFAANSIIFLVSLLFVLLGWRVMKRFGYILAQYV